MLSRTKRIFRTTRLATSGKAIYVCLLLLCSLTITYSFGQVSANFSIDTGRGCTPLAVHCTSTENDGVVNWLWTTSDGQTSTETILFLHLPGPAGFASG